MARPISTIKKHRLALDLAEPILEQLDWLKAMSGADTYNETIRRALSIYQALLLANINGSKIIIKDKDNNEVTVVLI